MLAVDVRMVEKRFALSSQAPERTTLKSNIFTCRHALPLRWSAMFQQCVRILVYVYFRSVVR